MKTRKKIRLPDARLRRPAHALHNAIGPRFAVHAAADLAEINLYDEIGFWGITAEDMRRALDGVAAKKILLRINSPGGEVWDGLAIYNDLLAHPAAVTVEITGLAASIASIIAMAGDEIAIAENGFMMIHNAWTIGWGDRRDMAAAAELLGQIDNALAETYAARGGIESAAAAELMDNETWFAGAAAVDAGFADKTLAEPEPESASALFDLTRFEHVPAALKRRIEDGLRAAGFSKNESRAAVAKGFDELPRRDAGSSASRREAGDREEIALQQGADALVARIRAAAGL